MNTLQMNSLQGYVRNPAKCSKYKILALVGQGQFGKVYCALDRHSHQLVALKELDPRRFTTKQFLRELRFLVSLRHPNIVAFHAVAHQDQNRYLVMDYCEGGTLRSLLEASGQLNLELSLKLITDILLGLEYAHSQGIVHCDIKPENILLRTQPEGWQACISDFGIARQQQEPQTGGNGDTGSPAYMAPERFYGQYFLASDLYAVGVLLYEMVLGCRPFSGIPSDLMAAHLSQPLQLPNTLPFILRSVLAKSLQKLPQRRFATATEMLKSIRLATEVERSQESSLKHYPSIPTVRQVPFQSLARAPLTAAVTRMAATGNSLALAMVNVLSYRYYPQGILAEESFAERHSGLGVVPELAKLEFPEQHRQLSFAQRVEKLVCTPQGCLVLTQTPATTRHYYRYNFYAIPTPVGLPSLVTTEPGPNPVQLRPEHYARRTLEARQLWLSADPQGQWLACATTSLQTATTDEHPPEVKIWRGPDWQDRNLKTGMFSERLIDLVVLDRRYALALTDDPTDPATQHLQIFTRWGRRVGGGPLGLRVDQLVVNPYLSGISLGLRHHELAQGVLISLRPWKIQRIPLGMIPHWVEPTPWGFVLADQDGQVLLLSQFGERLASFQVPGVLTAITALGQFGLLLATWEGIAGTLFTVDLHELGLKELF